MANAEAWNQGWQQGRELSQERRAHKQGLKDEELHGKIKDLIDKRTEIVKNIPYLQGQERDQANNKLTDIAHNLIELYHPDNNPNAIQKLGHLLTDHLGITNPLERSQKDVAKKAKGWDAAQKDAQGWAQAAPLSPEQTAVTSANANAAGNLASMQATLKNLKTLFPDATPEQMTTWQNELAQGMTGGKSVQEKYFSQLSTTVDADGKQHYWRVPMDPNSKPEEVDFNGQTIVGKTHPSSAMEAQAIRAKYGKDLDQLSPEQADEAIAWYRQQNTPTTTSTGETLVYDQNNKPHVFTHTGTSHKSFPGAKGSSQGAPSTPPSSTAPPASPNGATTPPTPITPKHVRNRADAIKPKAGESPKSPIGPAIPGFEKLTPDVTAANKKFQDATGLADFGDRVMKNPNNAQEQRLFAFEMARVMAGRFQMQEYDQEVKNSGIANSFQQWLNNLTTGALPPQILKHLVETAQDYKKAMDAEVAAAKGPGASNVQSSGDPDIDSIVNILNKPPQ